MGLSRFCFNLARGVVCVISVTLDVDGAVGVCMGKWAGVLPKPSQVEHGRLTGPRIRTGLVAERRCVTEVGHPDMIRKYVRFRGLEVVSRGCGNGVGVHRLMRE